MRRKPRSGAWTFWISQPKGLADGSRRSPRVFRGGDLRATAQERSRTPAGFPDLLLPSVLEIGVAQSQILAVRTASQVTRRRGRAVVTWLCLAPPLRGAGPSDSFPVVVPPLP